MTSLEPHPGPSPELVASLALQRAHGGGVAKLGDHYFDYGFPTADYLTEAFDGLVDGGLLALADPDPWGLQRVSLTDAGRTRHAQLPGGWAAGRVPDSQLPTTKTATGQDSPTAAQPDKPQQSPE